MSEREGGEGERREGREEERGGEWCGGLPKEMFVFFESVSNRVWGHRHRNVGKKAWNLFAASAPSLSAWL